MAYRCLYICLKFRYLHFETFWCKGYQIREQNWQSVSCSYGGNLLCNNFLEASLINWKECMTPIKESVPSGLGSLARCPSRCRRAELEIVVELGNLVPRKNLGSQKVFLILRYLQSWTAKMFLKLLQKLFVLLRLFQFLWHTHDFLFWNTKTTLFLWTYPHHQKHFFA